MKQAPIKSLPLMQRPRERLTQMGAHNLTVVELLAVIMGSGTKKQSVVAAAENLHKTLGEELVSTTFKQLQAYVGTVQACKVAAAIELGKRLSTHPLLRTIAKPQDVLREAEAIRHSHREHTIGLYLNARYELLKKSTLTIGTLNSNALEPRDVYSTALALPCRSLILIHNHPSGSSLPSDDDVVATKRLQQAGELLGITMLDHMIVTETDYFSFHQQKLLATLD